MTDDQQIRAIALAAAARFHTKDTWTPEDAVVLTTAKAFEAWVRDGYRAEGHRPGQ